MAKTDKITDLDIENAIGIDSSEPAEEVIAPTKKQKSDSVKKADAAIESKDANAGEAVKAAVKKIDQATAKGILHKNTAAHKKSALVTRLNKVSE